MINLVKNELIKLIKNKKLLSLIIILTILSLGLIGLCFFQTSNFALNKDINTLKQLKEKQSSSAFNSSEKINIENRINQLEDMINEYNNLENKNFDWKKDLKNKNEELSSKKTKVDSIENEILDTRIEMNNTLIDNNIKPSSKYNSNNYDFLVTFISIICEFFIFIIIAIIISDIISSEYSNNNIQTLLLLPIKRYKIIFSKVLSSLLLLISTFLAFDFIIFLISGALFSFGHYNEPIFVNHQFKNSLILNSSYNQYITPIHNTVSYMSVGELLIKAIIYQILFIVCSTLLCILISLLTKNNKVSLIITILIPIVAFFIKSIFSNTGILKVLSIFFVFLNNPIDILINKYPIETGCTYITYNSSLFILIAWSILLLILLRLFSKNFKYK